MRIKKISNRGFSLLEVVISLGIFSLLIAPVVSLSLGSFSFFSFSQSMDTGAALSHEAVEAVKSISDEAWNELNFNRSGVDYNTGHWSFLGEGTTEQFGDFTRTIDFYKVFRDVSGLIVASSTPGAYEDVLSRLVNVTISWNSDRNTAQSLVKSFILSNWKTKHWLQQDWSGGDGQVIDSDPTKYESADNISVSTSSIRLKNIDILGSGSWDYSVSGDYSYDSNKIIVNCQASLTATTSSKSYNSGNGDFATSTWGWSNVRQWNRSGNEVMTSGSRVTTGGLPGAYYRFTIPRGTNDTTGGWIERSFTITDVNPVNQRFQINWNLLRRNRALPDSLHLYAFIDKAPGVAPQIGSANQVWSSPDLIGVPAPVGWWGDSDIDVSSIASTSGTYTLKIAVWVDTPAQSSGEFRLGVDNAKVTWGWEGASYPTDKPSVEVEKAVIPDSLYSWYSFKEEATKNSGEIYYQLSPDGVSWYYWSGASWAAASSTAYNTAAEIDTQINKFSTSTKQIFIKSFLSSKNNEQVSLDTNKVFYLRVSPPSIGNQFIVSSISQTPTTVNNNYKSSYRFTVKQVKTVEQIGLYQSAYSGTGAPGNYRIGIQADNNGVPSGSYLGSASYTSNTTNNWVTTTISPSVSLASNTVYHIVIQRETGNRIRQFRTVMPDNGMVLYSGESDASSTLLTTTNGTAWADQNQDLSYILYFSDGTAAGNPIYSTNLAQTIYGNQRVSERFIYRGDNMKPIGFSVYVHKTAAGIPAGDLSYSLRNVDTNVEMASGTLISKNAISTSFAWASVFLDKDLTLIKDSSYRLSFYSTSSLNSNAYEMYEMKNDNVATMNNINYMGIDARYEYSTNNGTSWNSLASDDIAFKMMYNTVTNGVYEKSGYLISSAHNIQSGVYNSIDWRDDSACTNCKVRIWIKTAPDNGGAPGIWDQYWAGPTGKNDDESDYFSIKTGTIIDNSHNGDEWVKYKIQLEGNGDDSPTVDSIRINYK